jgi:Predicted membrane protein
MLEVGNIIVWVILGGISGWIASMITGKDAQMGIGMNILVGVIGAFIGGWLAGIIGLGPATGLNIWSFVVSIVGSIILLSIISLFKRKE